MRRTRFTTPIRCGKTLEPARVVFVRASPHRARMNTARLTALVIPSLYLYTTGGAPPGLFTSARPRGFPSQAAHRRRQALRSLLFVSLRLLLRRLLVPGGRRPRPADARLRGHLLHANLVRQHLPNVRGERPTLRRVRRVRRGGRLTEMRGGRGLLGVSAESAGELQRRRTRLAYPGTRAPNSHTRSTGASRTSCTWCAPRNAPKDWFSTGAAYVSPALAMVLTVARALAPPRRFHEIRRHGSNRRAPTHES